MAKAKRTKRYWVYVHDSNDDIIESRGEYDSLQHAYDDAGEWLHSQYTYDKMGDGNTIRIVDVEYEGGGFGGVTIWQAGPVQHTVEAGLIDQPHNRRTVGR